MYLIMLCAGRTLRINLSSKYVAKFHFSELCESAMGMYSYRYVQSHYIFDAYTVLRILLC